jgi:tetratricopeptide (TPR) repeat protein
MVKIKKRGFGIVAGILLLLLLFYSQRTLFMSGKMLYNLGVEDMEKGNHEDYNDWNKIESAIGYFEAAVNHGYDERNLFDSLAYCYHVLNDKQNEIRVYSLGLAKYPNDAGFLFDRGTCYQEMKNPENALKDFDVLIKTNPAYKYYNNAVFKRGAMRYILNDTLGAKADYVKARKINPKDYNFKLYFDYCRLWQ